MKLNCYKIRYEGLNEETGNYHIRHVAVVMPEEMSRTRLQIIEKNLDTLDTELVNSRIVDWTLWMRDDGMMLIPVDQCVDIRWKPNYVNTVVNKKDKSHDPA